MYSNNAFIVLRIANMLKSTYKLASKKIQKNKTTQDNRNNKAKKDKKMRIKQCLILRFSKFKR